MQAKGTFTVQLDPKESYNPGTDGNRLGRMTIDKTFEGDLKAISQGEMLSARTPLQGSAGYVALEQVSGELDGRSGSFVLQHFGTMKNGKDYLKLEVVPDSGTGKLKGLSGSMSIEIDDGVHRYQFDYQF
ncbi:DUF3224 domain-containing protein [Marinimicrobium sp. ABcell2]|uniref:DUF3224 domain-containing protein n=1 Tax=Marinimicrobium sp. ABcell2 TaxID=3069751 RepID=UPI0027AFA07D|nr:DUF3224 domain-containing protein [Marinimicrobium sp. ABcell2]MDQ2077119.1 DUF3224 domain-containing protein [Marinimicrobium sp. ABcell2]